MESSPAAVGVAINDIRAAENIEDCSVVLDDRIERSLEKLLSTLTYPLLKG